MVAPRRSSSRLSVQRHVATIRQSKKLEQQEAMKKHHTMKMKRKPMDVYVQILTGRCITLSVSPDDNIQDVMEKIKAKEGINPDQQLLLYAGKKLQTDVTVDDYMIRANSKLFLTLRGLGGWGRKTLRCAGRSNYTTEQITTVLDRKKSPFINEIVITHKQRRKKV